MRGLRAWRRAWALWFLTLAIVGFSLLVHLEWLTEPRMQAFYLGAGAVFVAQFLSLLIGAITERHDGGWPRY